MRHRRILPIFFVIVGLGARACSSVTDPGEDSGSSSMPATPEQAAPTQVAAQIAAPTENEEPAIQLRPSSGGTADGESEEDRRQTSVSDINPMDLMSDGLHPRIKGGWKTDFSLHSVPFNEIF